MRAVYLFQQSRIQRATLNFCLRSPVVCDFPGETNYDGRNEDDRKKLSIHDRVLVFSWLSAGGCARSRN